MGGLLCGMVLVLPARATAWLRWVAVGIAAGAVGGLLGRGADLRADAPDPLALLVATPGSRSVVIRGVVEPDLRWEPEGGRVRAALRVDAVELGGEWRPLSGRVWWTWYDPAPRLEPGMAVRVRGRLRQVRGFQNAGLFDYGRYLRTRGFHARLSARGPDAVICTGFGPLPLPAAAVARVRRVLSARVEQIPASPDARGFLLAVLAGDRRWVSADLRDVSVATGTYHLLSISGLHVGIVAGCLLLIARGMRLRGVGATVFAVCALALYAVLTGGALPVVRATMMFSVALVLVRLRRPPDGPSILACVAGIVALLDPLAFRSAGCQLSFGAVTGLVLVYRPAAQKLFDLVRRHVPRRLRPPTLALGHAILVSCIVHLAVAPVLLWHFHRVPLAGLVANAMATPLLAVVLVTGALACLGLTIHPWFGAAPAVVAGAVTDALLDWIRATAALTHWAPGTLAAPSPATVVAYVVLLGVAWRLLRHRPAWRLGTVTASVLLLGLGPLPVHPGALEVVALDVGQADATIVRFPTGQVMLIDGGARFRAFDTGRIVVVPALLRAGIRRIDWLVATHPQSDHIGGLLTVMDSLPVEEVWTNGSHYESWTARAFRARCAQGPRRVRVMHRGDRIRVGETVDVRVLNPPQQRYVGSDNDENNNSIALRIDYAGVAVLLPADASEALGDIIEAGAPWPERVIAKAPHHGYPRHGTAGPFRALHPLVAWASASAHWPERYPRESLGGAVSAWRTARDGGLRIRVEPTGAVTVQPTLGEPRRFPPPVGQPPRPELADADGRQNAAQMHDNS